MSAHGTDMRQNGSTHVSNDESLAGRVIRLTLNSQCCIVSQLKCVEAALELLTAALTDKVRQMIEGKLSSDGHEPSGVQVIFEPSGVMDLHDEEGEFVRKEPDDAAETETHAEESEPQTSGGKWRSSVMLCRKHMNK